MKKLILAIAIILTSSTIYSQLEVKEVGSEFENIHQEGQVFWLDVYTASGTAIMMYRNSSYKHAVDIKSLKFTDVKEFVEFLDICEKVASIEKQKTYSIQGNILIKNFLGKECIVYVNQNNYFTFDMKMIDNIRESIQSYDHDQN